MVKLAKSDQINDASNVTLCGPGINGLDLDGHDETLAADKPDVVVVFIGINDVWWRNTAPEAFEQALGELVKAARANQSAPPARGCSPI